MPSFFLKVDVDTHDGMRFGVPRLLQLFREFDVRATFFLSFGPDNAGKALWNVLRQPGFLRKMVRTRAPKLYGIRTLLSGTLLPARLIAVEFPDLVRRIDAEGHEVGVHAWDHRLWQDRLHLLSRAQIADQLSRACDAYSNILGRRPTSTAAPAWYATRESLEIQDELGLLYSSDIRGTVPCQIELDGYRAKTLQIPTTQPTLDEMLGFSTLGQEDYVGALLRPNPGAESAVLTVHTEVEGGPYLEVLRRILCVLRDRQTPPGTLEQLARRVSGKAQPAIREGRLTKITGRASSVVTA
jgi:undecaprenyl phosphate-alpha-L-ara4FN deformylase